MPLRNRIFADLRLQAATAHPRKELYIKQPTRMEWLSKYLRRQIEREYLRSALSIPYRNVERSPNRLRNECRRQSSPDIAAHPRAKTLPTGPENRNDGRILLKPADKSRNLVQWRRQIGIPESDQICMRHVA